MQLFWGTGELRADDEMEEFRRGGAGLSCCPHELRLESVPLVAIPEGSGACVRFPPTQHNKYFHIEKSEF